MAAARYERFDPLLPDDDAGSETGIALAIIAEHNQYPAPAPGTAAKA